MSLLANLMTEIKAVFLKDRAYSFFTEHDIHSKLAHVAEDTLGIQRELYVKTSDGFMASRVHHEYPTPFRCLMKGSSFRKVSEEEYQQERQKNRRFRARRGYFDFVVLNTDFVASNKLSVVSGKSYAEFLKNLGNRRFPALDLAIEVVYFLTFDQKLHKGIMERRIDSTNQDYQKLVALMNFPEPHKIPFCKEAAMLFFSNTPHKSELQKKLGSSIKRDKKVSLHSFLK